MGDWETRSEMKVRDHGQLSDVTFSERGLRGTLMCVSGTLGWTRLL